MAILVHYPEVQGSTFFPTFQFSSVKSGLTIPPHNNKRNRERGREMEIMTHSVLTTQACIIPQLEQERNNKKKTRIDMHCAHLTH